MNDTPNHLQPHYHAVMKAIIEGRLIPFLGAGVNRCGRPAGYTWKLRHADFLPDGRELSEHLHQSFGAPAHMPEDLTRISQYVSIMNGEGPLYEELHKVFDKDYAPTAVHRLLASLPGRLGEKGYRRRYQIIVTTNYDDVLERAFTEVGEQYDVVSYIASGEERGRVLHTPANGSPRVVDKPNEYKELALDQRTTILKIHGAVDRINPEQDSYVITEDDYIEYLKRTELPTLIPVTLATRLLRSQFLFLGYGLRDWNLRVILDRISENRRRSYGSWAIQLDPDPLDQRFWMRRDVEIIDMRLERYFAELDQYLSTLPPITSGTSR
jgi:hypothetical protein